MKGKYAERRNRVQRRFQIHLADLILRGVPKCWLCFGDGKVISHGSGHFKTCGVCQGYGRSEKRTYEFRP